MNDVGWIFTISIFWIFLIVGVTALASDSTLEQLYTMEGNFSYSGGDINYSSSLAAETSTLDFINTIRILFGFSVPTSSNMPQLLAVFISSLNWLIASLLTLLIYRQVRSGGG